jgi:hypothetical protein
MKRDCARAPEAVRLEVPYLSSAAERLPDIGRSFEYFLNTGNLSSRSGLDLSQVQHSRHILIDSTRRDCRIRLHLLDAVARFCIAVPVLEVDGVMAIDAWFLLLVKISGTLISSKLRVFLEDVPSCRSDPLCGQLSF